MYSLLNSLVSAKCLHWVVKATTKKDLALCIGGLGPLGEVEAGSATTAPYLVLLLMPVEATSREL